MTGPRPPADADRRRLDRAVYGPAPDPAAVDRLRALREHRPATDPPGPPPRRLPVRTALGAVALLAGLVAAVVSLEAGPARLAPSPPATTAAAGGDRTLFAFSRTEQQGISAVSTTLQPSGTVPADPRGHGITVQLRCTGAGEVVVALTDGSRFVFDCAPGPFARQTRTAPSPHRTPFIVIASTTGDVVWDLRVATLPA